MISIEDLKPAKAMSDSQQLDKDSILMLRCLLNHHHINDSQLQEGGTQDNTDGYIALLDQEDRPVGKVCVQVKHLTNPPKNGRAFYDIPAELIGYADRFKTDVILFIACDTDNKTIYWKCIDKKFITKCLKKGKQRHYRHTFLKTETANATNIEDTLAQWRRLYQSKSDSIRDEKDSLIEFMTLQRKSFNQIPTTFYAVKDSYIKRKAVDTLYDWVVGDLSPQDSIVKLLVGEAGVGKSVVIKSLIELLEANGIKVLSIKADRSNITEETFGKFNLQTLQSAVDLLASQQDKVVLIIDQIDALSQSLSNDRQKLNVLLDVIASLKKESPTPTRIIVSCRRYDLIYDSSLKSLGIDNAIELGAFSDIEIKSVLDKLSAGLFDSLNKQTRDLLKTAQLLDIFCRLYAGGHKQIKYDNEVALFDGLWSHLTNDCPEHLTSTAIEKFLFKLAETIQESETLSPFWTPSADESPLLQFLASEGVIRYEGGQVSFFHQSFLDYTTARQYVMSERSFIRDLEIEFQGLEIRSMIKLVLEYLRSHSEIHYKNALSGLIGSKHVRLHIKLLAVSSIASSKHTYSFERKIVREFYGNNQQLYAAFLNGASAEWFPSQYNLLRKTIKSLMKDSDLYMPIAFFLSRNAISHAEEVVSFVEAIEDIDTRNNLAYYLLRSDIDYRADGVKRLYRSLNQSNPGNAVDCISKAIETDTDFAIEETKNLLFDYLIGGAKRSGINDDYVLVEVICKKLFEERPKQFFVMMVECFLDVIEKKSTKTPYWYNADSVFDKYLSPSYSQKLYGWLVESAKMEAELAYSYVPRLIDTHSERAICLAFAIMICFPSKYYNCLKKIVSKDAELDKYLEYADFQYHFLELLKTWYPLLAQEDKAWYQKRVLTFRSYSDSLTDKDRRYSVYYYFSLWRRKWMLLYTIPEDGMIEGLRRCKLELQRRFHGDYKNEKPSVGVSMATVCGGITSSEVYKTFSEKAWLHSFYGIKEHRPWAKKDWLPFDNRIHAQEFSSCVAGNTSRYFDFVKGLFADDRVSDLYRFAGLKGLVEGGYDLVELIPLFRHFMTDKFLLHSSYDFFKLAGSFVKVEDMFDELVPYYRKIIISCKKEPILEDNINSMERHVTDILNHVINTTSGHALESLIEFASIKEFRGRVYKELEHICGSISPGFRLLVLYKIYVREYYEESLFNSLLNCYLPGMGTELLFLRPDLIQQYLYFHTEEVSDYMERVHKDSKAHVILAQIYFYGTCHSAVSEYCRSRFEEILAVGEENAISKMVEISYKYISDGQFSDLSESILLRFANDERELVRRAYLLHCDVLPISSFPFFVKISQGWYPEKKHEWHKELEYVLRCCGEFPVECYNYIKQQGIIEYKDAWRVEDDLVKVLLAIYKKLKYDDDRAMLEKLMDMFDVLILRGNSTVITALETMA